MVFCCCWWWCVGPWRVVDPNNIIVTEITLRVWFDGDLTWLSLPFMLTSNHKQSPLLYSVPVQLDSRQTEHQWNCCPRDQFCGWLLWLRRLKYTQQCNGTRGVWHGTICNSPHFLHSQWHAMGVVGTVFNSAFDYWDNFIDITFIRWVWMIVSTCSSSVEFVLFNSD